MIYKFGATTGLTAGFLRSDNEVVEGIPLNVITVDWISHAKPFTAGGDSGSLYFTTYDGWILPLAIHSGGDDSSHSYGFRLDVLLNAYDEDLRLCSF